jgi:hypothetical protein
VKLQHSLPQRLRRLLVLAAHHVHKKVKSQQHRLKSAPQKALLLKRLLLKLLQQLQLQKEARHNVDSTSR